MIYVIIIFLSIVLLFAFISVGMSKHHSATYKGNITINHYYESKITGLYLHSIYKEDDTNIIIINSYLSWKKEADDPEVTKFNNGTVHCYDSEVLFIALEQEEEKND